MTDEQGLAVARLARDFNAAVVTVRVPVAGLPDGYVGVDLDPHVRGHHFGSPENGGVGIAPNGAVSS